MIEITDKSKCCGCHGCKSICPKSCIEMLDDNEGFWYPKIDKNICIDCDLCVKICPNLKDPFTSKKNNIIAYACKNNNESIKKNSSSGGVFFLLCEIVINQKGVVFGASFDKNLNVRHTYAESLEECKQFRSSKYVQSKIGSTYIEVKKFLNQGRTVLFSGTPCQIEGLNAYLRKEYTNLIKVDIACHGVPSPKVYRQYIKSLENKINSKIKNIDFRNKDTGWNNYSFVATFENGDEIRELSKDNIYMKGYLKDIYLRPSCYTCEFKKPNTNADITLADYWGVKYIHSDFSDEKGISLVLTNTDRGSEIFESISGSLELLVTDYEYATKINSSIVLPAKRTKQRDLFFKKLYKNGELEDVIKKYTKNTLKDKINSYKKILNKVRRNEE